MKAFSIRQHAQDNADDTVVYQGISRRTFLLSGSSVAVGITFGGALTAMEPALAQSGRFEPNGWLVVATDGTVTVYSPASEMGQGVKTAMPLLIAEEMDLDWSKVRVQQAPHNPAVFGNPFFQGAMGTGASRTTQEYYSIMRLAGMQARQIMIVAAAEHWGVPASEVSTVPHHAVHKASGRRLAYGEIAAFATVPKEVPKFSKEQLKPMSQFRLIGHDVPRVDIPDKVAGKAQFGIDVRLPGMLYAAVLRAPVQGEQPAKIDDSAAKAIAGVKAVVPLPYGVGVVASDYATARKAKAALKVEWSKAAKARAYTSDKVLAEYRQRAADMSAKGVPMVNDGDIGAALAKAAKVYTAEYTTEHVAHTCMEPMNATAQVTGDQIEIWAPTQGPSVAQFVLSKVLGLFKAENIKINVTLLGGGFGRRFEPDFTIDAAILAKAMAGAPVKVIWSREDDIQNDKYRPLVAQHLTAGVDAKGNLVALQHRIVAESIIARAIPDLFAHLQGLDPVVCEGAEFNYAVANHHVEFLREERGVDVGFWRGVGAGYTKFSTETLIDELAAAAGKDPIDYRLAMLAKQPRAGAVIKEVARMAGWKKKRAAGRALGFAYSDHWNSHTAEIAEVSVDRESGRIRVHEVWAVVDPGVAVQPKNVAAQIESAIMYGTSHALAERITIVDGEVQQSNFDTYPVLRMDAAPQVHVKVMATDNYPGGVGETGLPAVSAAIANAVAKLTGKRLRALPFDQAALKA